MKRVHVIELEDQAWMPSWLRACLTRLLVVLCRTIGVTDVLAELVARALRDSGEARIVDLGSGAGGVMPEVLDRVRASAEGGDVTLTMTDLYPSPEVADGFNRADAPHVRYLPEAVDSRALDQAPAGLKTMINGFHHLRPDDARAVLASAQASRQPLLVYELGENKLPFAIWALLLPISLPLVALSALALTPLARPLTSRQLFFTYVIPVIPAIYAWDGQASMARLYGLRDLDELLAGLDSPGYRWEKGPARAASGKTLGTYLLGLPVACAD